MKISVENIFQIAIDMGLKNDPRGKKEVLRYLEDCKEEYKTLSKNEKKYYNTEYLNHPYHDSMIYHGKPNTQVKKIIVGIDVEGPEILLVHEYNKTAEKPIDLIVGHHPESTALIGIAKLQKDIAPFVGANTGIPLSLTEKIEAPRVGEVEKRFSPLNHHRVIPFAKMLNIPYLGFHTPADNCVHTYLEKLIQKNKNKLIYLQDIIDLLLKEPEMSYSKTLGSGPAIWNGEKKSRAGKIVVTGITGGTESSKDIYKEYALAGVGTILEMHMSAEHLAEAKKYKLNVIMTDHMASDSLGMNLILDEIEKLGVEILDFSGFTRFSRNT
ncbi:NGG1p interacting factor NIF3 [Candidatus Gracilibacteria bacterium]|nr:NGG1p interacting factor NIF3 [Candidatus Gracilibacteria bacterium]